MTKNSACWPLAVCSITHGAILRWNTLSSTCWPVAREELIPPKTAMVAAMNRARQKTIRNRDAAARFGALLIVSVASVLTNCMRRFTQDHTLISMFSAAFWVARVSRAGDDVLG